MTTSRPDRTPRKRTPQGKSGSKRASPKQARRQPRLKAPPGQQLYRQVVELSPDAIVIHRAGRYVYANQAAVQLFGATSIEQLLGRSVLDFVFPVERSQVAERLSEYGQSYRLVGPLEQGLVRLDGRRIQVEVRAASCRYQGEPAVQAILRDVTARTQAEQALRESESKFRALAETLPLAIGIIQGERFCYVNPASEKMSGYSENEFLEMSFWDIADPEFRDLIRRRGLARQKGEFPPPHYEVKMRTKSGDPVWVDMTLGLIEYRGAPAILATSFDITERKRADKLQKAVYQIAEAADAASSLDDLYARIHSIISTVMPANNFYIAIYDAEQDLISFPYFVDEVDVPRPPQRPGRGMTEYVLRTGSSVLLDDAMESELSRRGEVELVGVPSAIWLGVPLRVEDKTTGVMAVQHYTDPHAYGEPELQMLEFVSYQVAQAIEHKADLLARTRAEAALQVSEERYRNLFENAPIGIYRTTPDGKVLVANPAIIRMLGFDSFEELAKTDLQSQGREAGYRNAQFDQLMAEAGSVRGLESTWRTRDGREIIVRENAQATRGADGQILYYDGTVEDITERKQIEEAERKQRMLSEALRDTAAALNSTLDRNELLDRILSNVDRVVPHEAAFIMLVQDSVGRVVRTRGFVERRADGAIRQFHFSIDSFSHFREMAISGQPSIIADTTRWPEWVSIPETAWIRSELLAPIRAQDRLIGYLGLDSTVPNFFTPDHAARLLAFANQAAGALENARLLAETERRAGEFAALYETARDLATPQDLSLQLRTIVERARRLLSASGACIYLYDAATNELELSLEQGLNIPTGVRLQWGEGMAGRVAQTGQPIIVDDYRHWEYRSSQYEGVPFTAVVQVPMQAGGELLGVLGVNEMGTSQRRYSDADARLLALFATQAASAVRGARLFAETGRRADQFAALYEVAQELNRTRKLPVLLETIVARAIALLGAAGGGIYLYDPGRQDLYVSVSTHPSTPVGTRLKLGEAMAGRVAESRQPLIVNEYRTWEFRSEKYRDTPITAVIEVPMLYGGELIGVLVVEELGNTTRRFTDEDARLLSLFASEAAGIVRNANLLAETEQRANESAVLYETVQDLATWQELPVLLDLIVERAISLLSSPGGFIYLYDADRRDLELTVEKGGLVTRGVRLGMGEGIAGRVALSHQSLFVDDYAASPYRSPRYEGVPYAAVIEVPMLYGGELIGVLGVNEMAPSTRHFSSKDAQLLSLFAGQAASAVRNARLLQETRVRAQQLALLYDAGLTLNSVLEPRAQLEFLFKIAMRALHADRAEFFRYQPTTEEMVMELSLGYPPGLQPAMGKMRFPVASQVGFQGWVYQHRVPLSISDLKADPRYVEVDESLCSGLWAPVEHEGQLQGVFTILSTRPAAFSMQDERLLVLFANQASVALENARLYTAARQELAERRRVEETLRDKIKTLQTLAEIDQEVMASTETETVLHLVCVHTAELLHVPKVVVGVPGRHGVHILATHGLTAPEVLREEFTTFQSGLMGNVMSPKRLTMAIEQLPENDSRMPNFRREEGIVTMARSTLMAGERALGNLLVFDTEPRAWSRDDLELLSLLAGQAAIALEKTRLLNEVQDSLETTTRLYELSGQVIAANTFEETARLITHTLKEGMGADLTAIRLLNERGEPTFYYGTGYPAGLGEPAPPRPDGITMQVWKSGEPVIIDSPQRLNPSLRAIGIQSGIVLPLPGEVGLLGCLFVNYLQPHAFSEREVQLMQLFANQTALALRNVRLLEETRRRADELALVNQMAAALNHPSSLSDVLTSTVRELSRILNTDSGAVAIFTNSDEYLTIIADYNPDGAASQIGQRIILQDNPSMDYILRERRSLAILNVADPAETGSVGSLLTEAGIQSMLLLPLIVGNQVIGTIGLDSKKAPRVFMPEEIALAETLAHHAASAIERARLFDRMRQRADQLAVLNRIASAVSHSRHLDGLLETIYREVQSAFTVDGFFIALYDEDTDELDFRIRVDEQGRIPPGRVPQDSVPLTAFALTTRKTVLINDLQGAAGRYPSPVMMGSARVPRSWLGVPLQVGTKVIGILSVQAYGPHAYNDDDRQLLETIADQAAVAIENARLFEETRQRLAELEAINQISTAVRTATSSEEMLPRILDETLTAIGATTGLVAFFAHEDKVLHVGAARGWFNQVPRTLTPNEGIFGQVFTTGETFLAREFKPDLPLAEPGRPVIPGGWGGVVIPIRAGNDVIGILALSMPLPREILPNEMRLCRTIAEIAGSAVHRTRLHESLETAYLETVLALANAIDARDNYTHEHSDRLAGIAVALARELGLSGDEQETIRLAARLHDIGKIGVPDAVLLKPAALDAQEWQIMKRHPRTGAGIIQPVQRLRAVIPLILHHQERFDGTGYPDGLAGEAIPLGARILSLADAVSAMLDDRHYRQGLSWEGVIGEVKRCAGTQFDPKLVEVLLGIQGQLE